MPLVQALTAVQHVAPARELSALQAFQRARYVDGRDTAQFGVLATILRELDLSSAAEILNDEQIISMAKQRIMQGQQFATQHHVRGVPQLFVQHENAWQHLNTQQLLG